MAEMGRFRVIFCSKIKSSINYPSAHRDSFILFNQSNDGTSMKSLSLFSAIYHYQAGHHRPPSSFTAFNIILIFVIYFQFICFHTQKRGGRASFRTHSKEEWWCWW